MDQFLILLTMYTHHIWPSCLSLSGNLLAEPASMDAEMSANAEPAPSMMEQGGDHVMEDPAAVTLTLATTHTGEHVSPPWINTVAQQTVPVFGQFLKIIE